MTVHTGGHIEGTAVAVCVAVTAKERTAVRFLLVGGKRKIQVGVRKIFQVHIHERGMRAAMLRMTSPAIAARESHGQDSVQAVG